MHRAEQRQENIPDAAAGIRTGDGQYFHGRKACRFTGTSNALVHQSEIPMSPRVDRVLFKPSNSVN
jgi:hypothetical protein